VKRAGTSGYLGTVFGDLAFGLGDTSATAIEVDWPDKERTTTRLRLNNLHDGLLVISKTQGLLAWRPHAPARGSGAFRGRRAAG
jgi:hypothetical protein